MSKLFEHEALKDFARKRVNEEMIRFLAANTKCIIRVINEDTANSNNKIPSLVDFIKGLVIGSNVQTPTLMSTIVYLTKLRSILPTNVYGIETTRHRIFVGCLILAAKNLNDSSPLNKHWTKYTNGLLTLQEINTIERELLQYFDWKITFSENDLLLCLEPLLLPIRQELTAKYNGSLDSLSYYRKRRLYHQSGASRNLSGILSSISPSSSTGVNCSSWRSLSNNSIPSLQSSSTISSIVSTDTANTSISVSNNNNCNSGNSGGFIYRKQHAKANSLILEEQEDHVKQKQKYNEKENYQLYACYYNTDENAKILCPPNQQHNKTIRINNSNNNKKELSNNNINVGNFDHHVSVTSSRHFL
ncbi:cyclin PCL2 SCDLUD_000317 [Saccharomycodes ludwigii]|uniref:cyclin PCL2 n=1 Tax=Saccharomycodes ludwigii TaxID=36035 RepID=UPI001E8C53AF|nr:hypothetical protein SCDLUD_000317 [Saccharomycodes ludwigii]KAH3902731.1 hypothetical protein SCDLUD_000317 [Saccharomycodes ludwigii]